MKQWGFHIRAAWSFDHVKPADPCENGNIIYNTSGNVVTGAYAVTSGGEYFSINSLGRNMIIKDTRGASKQVTIKVTALNKTKEISFTVKAGG